MILKFVLSFVVLSMILWGAFEATQRITWNSKYFKALAIAFSICVASAITLFLFVSLF